MTRKIFVTTALPYANGPFHIGHIMEYIQADIWVRFQRMQGHEVHFVVRRRRARRADHARGREAEGITPQELVARDRRGPAAATSTASTSRFDHWYSTDSPENTAAVAGHLPRG